MKDQQEPETDFGAEGLVDSVSEHVTTDSITDLKNGIYNLFVSLTNNLMITKGIEGAITESCDFLDEIARNFRSTLIEPDQE